MYEAKHDRVISRGRRREQCPLCFQWVCSGHLRSEVEAQAEQLAAVVNYLRQEGHTVEAAMYHGLWVLMVEGWDPAHVGRHVEPDSAS
jgi:hypothetical protein